MKTHDVATSFSVERARRIQVCLSKKIILEDKLPSRIKTVGGIDVAYLGDVAVGAAVVLDYSSLDLLECKLAVCKVMMPYVPTLLSFREVSPSLAAIRKLVLQPDIFIVDAQGYAHPYRCGFASYLGLAIKKPTIGAAKTRLLGEPVEKTGEILLSDKGEIIGSAVTTLEGAKPIYVSVGHMISLPTAVRIVKHCSKTRIPEPIVQAHRLATTEKIRLGLESKVNNAEA